MKNFEDARIRPLTLADVDDLSELLQGSAPDYCQHFRPFAFDAETIRNLLKTLKRDFFFGIALSSPFGEKLGGFYMLRGMDEGFESPMYGVFISAEASGRGLARLSLEHAEGECKKRGYTELKLKVHPANARARKIYESCGFTQIGFDPRNANLILSKQL